MSGGVWCSECKKCLSQPRRKKYAQPETFIVCEDCQDEIEDKFLNKEEPKKTEEKTWISLGNRQFYVEDVQSIFIQANHLIINFDYVDKQLVIFFGHDKKGYENAKAVFDLLGDMYKAYRIPLPEDAIPDPDILKTVYGHKIDKAIQDAVSWEKEKFKKRHQRKLSKAVRELEELKKKIKQ